jgi:hypothetical protein
MPSWGTAYSRCYTFHGDGDAAAAAQLQAQLRLHGTCSYFAWDPRPPNWRFFYETDLSYGEIQIVLGTLLKRFHVRIED